jgi:hypothetical protein
MEIMLWTKLEFEPRSFKSLADLHSFMSKRNQNDIPLTVGVLMVLISLQNLNCKKKKKGLAKIIQKWVLSCQTDVIFISINANKKCENVFISFKF